jgi:RHS repeat-associated protein
MNQSNLTEVITYDNLNRVYTSTLGATQNLKLTYYNTGNINQRTECYPVPSCAAVTYTYSYDATHVHAVSELNGVGPANVYDANGNATKWNSYSAVWASYNLPTVLNGLSGAVSDFYYGPDRQRKEQVATYVSDGDTGTETTVYVAGLYEYETTPAQNHNKYFIPVPGGTHIIYDIQSVSGAQTTYITADHLGSGNLLINGAGTKLINESYAAFGYRRASNWSGPLSGSSSDYTTIASTTRRGYTDGFHEMLDNVSLVHMNGRVYDPVIGRFLSADPKSGTIGPSQSWNPYAYVLNRPLTLSDPRGMAANCQSTTLNPDDSCPPPALEITVTTTRIQPPWPQAPAPQIPNPPDLGGAGTPDIGGTGGGAPSHKTPTMQATPPCAHGWAVQLGNTLAATSDELGQVSLALTATGAGIAGAGIVTAQPEVVATGGAVAAVGGYAGLGSGLLQVTAGLLQGYGGTDYSNAVNGAATLLAGWVVGLPFGVPSGPLTASGTSRAAFMQSQGAAAGTAFNLLSDSIPNLGPQQKTCASN